MEVLKKITAFVSRYMAIIVILVAALALFVPSSVSFLKTSYVNPLLGIVMFGMGLTLKPHDFKVVFSRPKDVIIGCCAQFAIMPFLAFALTKVFGLSPELAIGVILVGTCPGGTSSNVMTYLSKGDVALSVGMTACSTILAPFLTPALTYLYAGQTVDVDIWSMFLSIVQVVILPIVLGFLINHFFQKFTEAVVEILPLVSTLAIVAIVAAVVSANSANLMTSGAADHRGCHPAQRAGISAGLCGRKAAEAGRDQVPRHLHRGRHAELRSGHLSGYRTFCPVSAGYDSGSCVQRMAQRIRSDSGELLCENGGKEEGRLVEK